MDYSYKTIQKIISDHSKDELVELAEQYIHHERNRKMFLTRMLDHPTIEDLAYDFELTPRRCADILKECSELVFIHMIP